MKTKFIPKIKSALPFAYNQYRWARKYYQKNYNFSKLEYLELADILINKLRITRGDKIFVHTSLTNMKLVGFNELDIIFLLKYIVGQDGLLAMPSFNKNHYTYLQSKSVFNVSRTMGYNGLINELLRMQKDTKRSCHPLKSVVAWGNEADYFVKDHIYSELAFDKNSPFYKLYELKGKIIGIGASSKFLSFLHTVEDTNPQFFLKKYSEPIEKKCINNKGVEMVNKYRHDLPDVVRNQKVKRLYPYLETNELYDFKIGKVPFFVADAEKLYKKVLQLAEKNITIHGDMNISQKNN